MHTYEQADDHKSFFTPVFNTKYIFWHINTPSSENIYLYQPLNAHIHNGINTHIYAYKNVSKYEKCFEFCFQNNALMVKIALTKMNWSCHNSFLRIVALFTKLLFQQKYLFKVHYTVDWYQIKGYR